MKFLSKIIFLFLCILRFTTSVNAQVDTAFWFSAPYNAPSPGDRLSVYVTTLDEPATVTFSMPANSGFTPLTVTLPADTTYRFALESIRATVTANGSNTVENRGLKITATKKITAYYSPRR